MYVDKLARIILVHSTKDKPTCPREKTAGGCGVSPVDEKVVLWREDLWKRCVFSLK